MSRSIGYLWDRETVKPCRFGAPKIQPLTVEIPRDILKPVDDHSLAVVWIDDVPHISEMITDDYGEPYIKVHDKDTSLRKMWAVISKAEVE